MRRRFYGSRQALRETLRVKDGMVVIDRLGGASDDHEYGGGRPSLCSIVRVEGLPRLGSDRGHGGGEEQPAQECRSAFGKPPSAVAFARIIGTRIADKKPPVLIAGKADNGGGGIANGFAQPYQKMRTGLGLLTDAGGNKAVVVSLSINGENPEGPGHGFVVAYDVRGLNREPGFTPTPAIWNVHPGRRRLLERRCVWCG